jgi:DNA-binding NarL/FixJ family response regulator
MFSGDPEFEVVGEASDGAEAVTLAGRLLPDVILMDLRMPGVNGAAAIRELSERNVPSRVLVLTTYDTDSDVVPAIEAGATGYLLKDSPREELFRAVRAASRGESVLASSVATRLMSQLREPGTGRPQRARAPGLGAHRPRTDESRRGRSTVHLGGDGQDAPAPHLREAGR